MTTLQEEKFCITKKFYQNETAVLIYDISDEGNQVKTSLITQKKITLYESYQKKNKKYIKISETDIVSLCFEKDKGDKLENKVSFALHYSKENELSSSGEPEIGKYFNNLYFSLNEIENNLKVEVGQKDDQYKASKEFTELINKISIVKILVVLTISSLEVVIIFAFFAGSEVKKLKFSV